MLLTKYKYLALYFLSFTVLISPAQKKDTSWKLYDDSQVAVVEITMEPSDLENMIGNPYSDEMKLAEVHFKNAQIDETIDSVGIRVRGNTSRDSQKKSFKISFNYFIKERKFHDVKDLNLNGEHNDPSIIRSELVWDLFQDIGMNASRAAHAAVYINGNYYGLYISIENIDDEFVKKNYEDDSGNLWKCLYPADLVYKGTNPDLYKTSQENRRTYELKTNEDKDDYTKLARLINIINNTPDNILEDSLEKVLAVPEVLKYFAMDIMVGSWDDYWFLKNNYYIYHEPDKDIFHWIPYDYDNTFGIDWFNIDWTTTDPYIFANIDNTPRPLVSRLMNNPKYRNLYSHFLQFYRNNVLKLSIWEDRIDRIKNLITPYATSDTYRTLDYNFTMSDFNDSYSSSNYSNKHVKKGLKQFINERYETLIYDLTWQDANPICYNIDWYPKNLNLYDTIYVIASAYSVKGIKDVSIEFSYEDEDSHYSFPMTFLPLPNTKKVEEADRYVGKIPPLKPGKPADFTIQVTDTRDEIEYYPKNYNIKLFAPESAPKTIVLNEFLAKNDNINQDLDGQYDDWLELYNTTDSSISLTEKYLTNSKTNLIKWEFLNNSLVMEPHQFLLVWCDNDTNQSGFHTNFKLTADGEFVALVNIDGITILDSISIGKQTADISFGRYPDGSDNWQFLKPTPAVSNVLTEVIKNSNIAKDFHISAFPNPFNPSTKIEYQLPVRSDVSISIFNMLGSRIWYNEIYKQRSGNYSVIWNGVDIYNNKVSSGIYFCTIKAGNLIKTIKLMLMK